MFPIKPPFENAFRVLQGPASSIPTIYPNNAGFKQIKSKERK